MISWSVLKISAFKYFMRKVLHFKILITENLYLSSSFILLNVGNSAAKYSFLKMEPRCEKAVLIYRGSNEINFLLCKCVGSF